MTISFSGLASGLDTSSWVEALVSVKQEKVTTMQTALKALQTKKSTLSDTRSAFNSLRTALEKITDKKFGGTFDLFSKNSAVSSNEEVFTATADSNAQRQSYDISVQRLATYTKAASLNSASSTADDSTLLSGIGITAGKLTLYVDGVKNSVTITDDMTVGEFKNALSAMGVAAEIDEDGFLNISSSDHTVDVGSTTDTTNMASLIGLSRQEDGTYKSTTAMFKANLGTKLTDINSGFNTQITTGTFTIGNAEFEITDGMTLADLIAKINTNDDAQVNAYWDDTTGKLNLTSKKEGASYINIESGTSNFTDVMGLTSGSTMYMEAQELGQNALFTLNGTSMVSTSNTISSDISRIEGVTITLKKVSTEEDGVSTLSIGQDSTGLVDAVKNFVSAYNDLVDKVSTVTASGADLQRETTLTSLMSSIRNTANASNNTNGGAYRLLAQIGISTAKADGSNLSTDTSTLEFDEQAFLQALEEDPDSLESILGGENGILNQMENTVEMALKSSVGFFDVKQASINSDIKTSEAKIKKQQEKITTYKAQLEKKFSAMETLIAQMQQNYSSFLGG